MVLFCFGDMVCGILPCRRSPYNLLPSGGLVGGAVLAEQVFSYPGLGQATGRSGFTGRCSASIRNCLSSVSLFVFVGNLLADFIYQFVDPRTRRES